MIEIQQRLAFDGICLAGPHRPGIVPVEGFSDKGEPVIWATVGITSISEIRESHVRPAGMRPGKLAINGTRTPPSYVIPFLQRSSPLLP